MHRKIFLIMPNADYSFDLSKFHNYINNLYSKGYFYSWWHYLPGGLYFVDTHLDVNQIYNLLITHMPRRYLIIMEVNPHNQQGWLPQEAWNWFNERKNLLY